MRLRDIPTSARLELLDPLTQRPSRRYLLQQATTACQSYFNEFNASGRPWMVEEAELNVSAGSNQFDLGVTDIFRILDVTTKDPSNESHIERPVNFWDLGELRGHWDGPRNADWRFSDSTHTAQRIAFYRKIGSDTIWAEVWPIPQDSAAYRVLYSRTGSAPDMSLDDSPLLRNHHHLIVLSCALNSLPACMWSDNEAVNVARRADLERSFVRQIPEYKDQFRRQIRTMTVPRQTSRLTYSIDEY